MIDLDKAAAEFKRKTVEARVKQSKQALSSSTKGASKARSKPKDRNTTQGNDKHRVVLCKHADPGKRAGRRSGASFGEVGGKAGKRQLFAFSWEDVAILLGVSAKEAQILSRPLYKYVKGKGSEVGGKKMRKGDKLRDGLFDPTDLVSLFSYRTQMRALLRDVSSIEPPKEVVLDLLLDQQATRAVEIIERLREQLCGQPRAPDLLEYKLGPVHVD